MLDKWRSKLDEQDALRSEREDRKSCACYGKQQQFRCACRAQGRGIHIERGQNKQDKNGYPNY